MAGMDGNTQTKEPMAAQLARFVNGLRFEDLPKAVVDRTKALVLDQFSCQLIGSTMPWVSPARELVNLSQSTTGESTIVNIGTRVLASDAAFLNATFGHACEMDDTAFGSNGHLGTATSRCTDRW